MSKIYDALKKAEGALADTPDPQGLWPEQPVALHMPASTLENVISALPVAPWVPSVPDLLLATNGHQAHSEPFRRLRQHLSTVLSSGNAKSMLVTSALPGEGKTFISANLAVAVARREAQRVLLIDGDLHRGAVSTMLGATRSPGLAELLAGTAQMEQVIQRSPFGSLYLISAGDATVSIPELLHGDVLQKHVGVLKQTFDLIIIDSPAALTVADAVELGSAADSVLLVVQAGEVRRDSVQKVRDLFAPKVVGVVLNRSAKTSVSSGYAGSYDYAQDRGDKN